METELNSFKRDCKKAKYEQELELITNYPKSFQLELELNDLKQKYQTAKGENHGDTCAYMKCKQFVIGNTAFALIPKAIGYY